jgi:hypothetical protein
MAWRVGRRAKGSKSRPGAGSPAAVAIAIAAAVFGACNANRAAPDRGPFLVLSASDAGGSTDAPGRGAALALGAMPPRERGDLRDALSDLVERLEIRHNPLVVDLEPAPIDQRLDDLSSSLLPILTAAISLASQDLASPDGSIRVRVTDRCPDRAGQSCIALSNRGASRNAVHERARFLAWAVTRAVRLRFASRPAAEQAISVLRTRLSGNTARTALVLSHEDAIGRTEAVADEIRALAARARAKIERRAGNAPMVKLLGTLATAPPAPPLVPWIALGETEVLVVPRMGALADPDGFVREVRAALSTGDLRAEWITPAEAPNGGS